MPEQQPIQPISENLWWVLPGKLAGVRKPSAEELNMLREAGIGAIVSVLDDSENLSLYQEADIPHLWLPTQGGAAPSQRQVQELQEFIDQQSRIDNAIAIHCTNGRRRTATMIAAHLISSGSSFEEAMQKIQTANSNIDLRETQMSFLRSLARK